MIFDKRNHREKNRRVQFEFDDSLIYMEHLIGTTCLKTLIVA